MNIQLHPEAVLLKEIIKDTETTSSGIILTTTKEKEQLCKVIAVGSKVENLQEGQLVRAKSTMGEKIQINFEEYIFFPYGDTCFYYIQSN